MELKARVNRPYISADGGVVYSEIDLHPGDQGYGQQTRRNLAVCIDRSGSMNFDEKLVNAKEGARAVLGRLSQDDRIGIYTFSEQAETVLPMQQWGELESKNVEQAIDEIVVDKSTNIEAGLRESRDGLKELLSGSDANRILLLSDGNPNAGITSVSGFKEFAQQLGNEGISVIAAGIGTDYDEDIIRTVAEASQGRWDHITSPNEIKQFFVDEAHAAGQTILGNPKVELELASGVEVGEVYRRMPQIQQVERDLDAGTVTIPMPDLENREKQELVFQLHVPGGEVDQSKLIADVSLKSGTKPVDTEELSVTYSTNPAKYGEEEAIRAKFVHAKGIEAGLEGDTAMGTQLLEGVEGTFTDPLAQRILNVGKTDVSNMANANNRSERLEKMKEGSSTGQIEADEKYF